MATANEDDHTSGAALPPPPRSPLKAELRRQSAGDRLNEILDSALQRAETLDPDSLTIIRQNSSHKMTTEDGDDETTGIVSRGSGRGYQAIQVGGSGTNVDTARSRKVSYSNGLKKESGTPQPASSSRQANENAASGGNTATETKPSWLKRTFAKFHSVELENKGSVARDHLALERTFLAWMRTSLAFASIGVAVTQLFRLNTTGQANAPGVDGNKLRSMGRPLGATFLAISIVTLLLGCKRYFHSQEWIMKGKFPASRGTILIMSFIALSLMLLSLIVVIVIQPTKDDQ